MKTSAQKKAQEKYMKTKARLGLTISKDEEWAIIDHIRDTGEGKTAFIMRAIKEQIERDNNAIQRN